MTTKPGSSSAPQPSAAASDLRPLLSRAFDQAEAVIASLTDDQLTLPTPCTEWDVRALLSHMVLAARRNAAVAEGRSALEVHPESIPDGEVRQAFHEAREASDRAWADDEALTREVQVPWGRIPGAVVIGAYLTETVTHTWDLWMATGGATVLDPELGGVAVAVAYRSVPADRDQFPFAPVVDVPESADAYTRLAGWMGRTPDWRTAAGPGRE